MVRRSSLGRAALLALTAVAIAVPVSAQAPQDLFENRVRPILVTKCQKCHQDRVPLGGLSVTSRQALVNGGDSGPAIVPGDPGASLLVRLVRHEIEGKEMPFEEPQLDATDIDAIVEWISADAPWPADAVIATAVANEGLSPSAQIFIDSVRPLLTQRCFACHTDDESGGLRLDSLERMLQGGSRGPAIIPGIAEQSLLIAAVRHQDEDLQMPRGGARLTDQEIEGLVAWIRSGSEWADVDAPLAIPRRVVNDEERAFWSFRPLSSPAVPTPATPGWAKTDIDRFILAKLEEKGLAPVGMADRRRLLRRASFDLIGLPPTPEEVEEFVNDTSPDAFEKVIDRLLASPHYGERWGRHWLDVARYGEDDTRGLAVDQSGREQYPSAYVYRDWVIQAFNEDMPFDVFVKAQLAGDLLEGHEEADPIRGLGFLGGGPWYYDLANEVISRADERHDRVDVTTRGFLGLTVGCARCHDHKYDPIGTHDYYALAGIFNNTDYHEYLLADDETAAALEADKEFIDDLQKAVGTYRGTERQQLARVLTMQISSYMMAAWQVIGEPQLPVVRTASRERVDLELLQRYIRFLGKEPKHYSYLIPWQEMVATDGGTEERAQELADDFQRLVVEIVAERDELQEMNKKIIAKGTSLEDVESTPMPNGFKSFFDLAQLELETMEIERLKLWGDIFAEDLDNPTGTYDPQPALLSFSGWSLERQLSAAATDHLAAMRERIEELREELPDIPFVMGVQDKDDAHLTEIGLHIRGDPRNLGEKVPRGFPPVLSDGDPEPYAEGSGRLQLAEDIAAHPITARVIVNRIWAWHLGSGIVGSPSNFGFAGARPTHPELLEYLTSRFVDNGMSIKALHRDIMLSTVYQLDTGQVPANEAIDRDNFYYWRANRRRLDAEGIRDSMLMASGTLDRKVGGPSMELGDEKNNRRTVYGMVSRFQLDEFLQTFDFANPNLTAEKRHTTNVPLQSLFFLNSDLVHRQAELLVKRLATETSAAETGEDVDANGEPGGEGNDASPDGRSQESASAADSPGDEDDAEDSEDPSLEFDDRAMIAMAYPLLYGREVTGDELAAGLEFLAGQRASFLEKELAQLAEAESEADPETAEAADVMGRAATARSAETARAAAQTRTTSPAEDAADTHETEGDAGEPEDDPAVAAEQRASMKAWIQYARALFSAAEFRYID